MGEKDVLQDQLSDQMHMISSLQLRLDEQRLRVESVQKESNTALEHKVYDLESEIQALNEEVHIRDKTIRQLNNIVDQTKKLLADQQKQLNTTSDLDKELIDQLHKETESLKTENTFLKNRLQTETKLHPSVATPDIPELLDSMLSEKNADIDRLRAHLDDIKEEVEFYRALNLSRDQLLQISNDSKETFINIHSISGDLPDQYRKQSQFSDSISDNNLLDNDEGRNKTIFTGSSFRDPKYANKKHSPFIVPEISTIERIDPKQLNLTEDLEIKRESLSLPCDAVKLFKKVHFQDCEKNSYEEKIKHLQKELDDRDATLKNLEETILSEYIVDIRDLRKKLEFSEENLKETKEVLAEEIADLKEQEKKLRLELSETKTLLENKADLILNLKEEMEQKDTVYSNIIKEKLEMQNHLKELDSKLALFNDMEMELTERNKEMNYLEQQLSQIFDPDEVGNLRSKIEKLEDEFVNIRQKNMDLETKLKNKDEELLHLKESLRGYESEVFNKNELLSKYEKDYLNATSHCEALMSQIKTLEETIANNDLIISDLRQDIKQKQEDINTNQKKVLELQNILSDYQYKMDSMNKDSLQLNKKEIDFLEAKYKTELAEKDLKLTKNDTAIDELNKEIHHLQDFLYQKDKIITQMTRDSTSLHQSLEAIQTKIQESGNVIDLKKRLRDEQALTSALHEELQYLKRRLGEYETSGETSILRELKDSLEKEHALNTELLNIRETLIQDLHILEQKFDTEKDAVNRLQLLLDEEKQKSNAIQLHDANIIEKMRERLEQALDSEKDLLQQLEYEKRAKEEIQQKTGSVGLDSDKTNDPHFELACIKMDLVKATTENDILKSEFSTLNNLNALLKAEVHQTKQLTEVQKSEIDELKEKVHNLKDSEQTEKNKTKRNKQEIEQRNLELESNKGLLVSTVELRYKFYLTF